MIVYVNILERLADAGWSTYRLIREKQIGNSTLTRLRNGESISTDTLDRICELCKCQPGDILRHVPGKCERG